MSRRRTTFGCPVNTAKWIGAWASSFFKSNSHGAGANRMIAQIMFGISLIIARCSWLVVVIDKKETRKLKFKCKFYTDCLIWLACNLKHETNHDRQLLFFVQVNFLLFFLKILTYHRHYLADSIVPKGYSFVDWTISLWLRLNYWNCLLLLCSNFWTNRAILLHWLRRP